MSTAPITTNLLPGDGTAVLYRDVWPVSLAAALFDDLAEQCSWEDTTIVMFGKAVREPRRSAWHADAGVTYRYSGSTRSQHPWTPALTTVRARCEEITGCRFNGVLANLYRDGRDSMGWHADDEKSLGADPTIASVSFGAERRFQFRHRASRDIITVDLPHNSLLVMAGPCQMFWKHRIAPTTKNVEPRINLTFRHLITTDLTTDLTTERRPS